MRHAWLLGLVAACGSAPAAVPSTAQVIVVCPVGSDYDAGQRACVARPGTALALAAPPPETARPQPPPPPPTRPVVAARPDPFSGRDDDPPAPPPPPPPTTASVPTPPPPPGAIDVAVSCGFAKGWVSVMPASAYPRDDEFLMQALIGFTTEPSFWNQEREYLGVKPFAAKPCTVAPSHFSVAPGDYYVLAGQADTFGSRGKYDRNGYKKRSTITSSMSLAISGPMLTHTWDCISCPWVLFEGSDTSPFVLLAWRDDERTRGTDAKDVRRVPVHDGRVRARVIEREDEETHLDAMTIVVRDRDGVERHVSPVGGPASALFRDDGVEVRMRRGSEITVEYDVSALVDDGAIDLRVVGTGYYVPYVQ